VTGIDIDVEYGMETPDGAMLYPTCEAEAAWYAVEHQAYPLDPGGFAWDRVLTLTGARPVNPAVYHPGSVL